MSSNNILERKKIRVLHFAKIISRNDFVDSIVSNLDPEKFEVVIITFQDSSLTFAPVFKEKKLEHINLNIKNAWCFQNILPAISRVIKEKRIDIFHAHLFEEQFSGAFLKLRFPKVKFIIGRHYSDEIYLLHKNLKRKAWVAIENFANHRADAIVAGSQMVKDLLLKQNISEQKIASIPYGFDFTDYRYQKNSSEETEEIRKKHMVEENDLLLVNVGRLFKLKGQDLLIEVFAELYKIYPHLKLLIVGDGDERATLQNMVKQLQLQEVIQFTGWLKDAHKYVSAADIVVHPTLSEMFSQLMIESMALQKPLVINYVSGVPDVIIHKWNGMICNHNYKEWFEALQFLIENKNIREEMGYNAEQHVKRNYQINNVILKYQNLYEDLNSKN